MFKSFVYGNIIWIDSKEAFPILMEVLARKNSKPICSGGKRTGPCYDTLALRKFGFVPPWNIAVFFMYVMRRVNCKRCILGRTAWLWCFTNAQLAYYVLTSSRAGPVVKEVLAEGFKGIMITDFFAAYDQIQAFAKQRCVVHLLREIKQVSLRNCSSEWQRFARRLKRLIHEALKLVIDRENIGQKEYDRRVANLHIRLADVFGISYRNADSKRLSKRLAKYSNEILTFLLHSNVPADNNHAERQIRFAVIMRKNYFGNRSMRGAETQAILMSVFRTCHLRGIDPISFLADSVASAIRSRSPLPIPNSSQTAKLG